MATVSTSASADYVPPAGDAWRTIAPREAGFDPDRLAAAVAFANAHECAWPRSMYLDSGEYVGTAYVQEKPPYNEVIGEVRPRGGVNGLILRGGRIVAEFGDTRRADMTFSVAKSYIALVAGLVFDRGLFRLDDRVADTVPDEGFASPHNSAKSTSGATPFGRTQYSMTGGPPSVRGANVVSDGRMSQPCARCTMSSIGCPGPIGSSPGGGSGCIRGITGLTDSGCPQLVRGTAAAHGARGRRASPPRGPQFDHLGSAPRRRG